MTGTTLDQDHHRDYTCPVNGKVQSGSLVLYKTAPAIVRAIGEKIEIEKQNGETVRVRSKDIVLLHPGRVTGFGELADPPPGEVEEAWEILQGTKTTLKEAAELAYGEYTPPTAWAFWQAVADGSMFRGTPDELTALGEDEVRALREALRAEEESRGRRAQFLKRLRSRTYSEDDRGFLGEVELLALGKTQRSPLMREIGRAETGENAHRLLLELGVWDQTVNPYPSRAGLFSEGFRTKHVAEDGSDRRDLRGLQSLAIDDDDTTAADDAVSFDDGSLWVHIADPSAYFNPGDENDAAMRERGLTLHLPERIIHMVPEDMIGILALGRSEASPALSFRIEIGAEGEPSLAEVCHSWIRAECVSYDKAESLFDSQPLVSLDSIAAAHRARRESHGAVSISIPEVQVRVMSDGQVRIRSLPRSRSRDLVQEIMIMTGSAVARWAREQDLAMPYTTQEAGDIGATPQSLAEMWAARRKFRRSRRSTSPGQHAGLGLASYVQATSPLRRYLDLLAHYQIHRVITGASPLDAEQLLGYMGQVEGILPMVRQAEQLSEMHWKLVHLERNAGWRGEAIVVERRGRTVGAFLPDLALETELPASRDLGLDTSVEVGLRSVSLPDLRAEFVVTG